MTMPVTRRNTSRVAATPPRISIARRFWDQLGKDTKNIRAKRPRIDQMQDTWDEQSSLNIRFYQKDTLYPVVAYPRPNEKHAK